MADKLEAARPAGALHYPAAIFISGFLLFLVQPLLAKAILPWFGGATGVWATALVFYQTLLLAGYAYAHWCGGLPPSRQAAVHLALLLLSAAWLPIIPAESWKPLVDGSPSPRVLALLAATVAGPYLLLASTSPLLQSWYSQAHDGRPPYRLYAVSNAGSLAGLFAYPFLLEPLLDVRDQAMVWSAAYLGFALLAGTLAWTRRRTPVSSTSRAGQPAVAEDAPSGTRPGWFIFPLCGSALLVAVTNQVTMDLAAVPFLWVIPLATYLVSYILAFAGMYRRSLYGALLGVALAAMATVTARGPGVPILIQIGVAIAALFAATMVCHGELVASAPRASAEGRRPPAGDITRFYLVSAAGGAAGGALVALVAPAVLPGLWELPIFLLLSYAFFLRSVYARVSRRMTTSQRALWWAGMAIVVWLASTAFILPLVRRASDTIATTRNFYGVLRVIDEVSDTLPPQRKLLHGRILHGSQLLVPGREREATTYYARGSGIELAFRHHPGRTRESPLRVGVIGLGVGTIAALAHPADSIRFFELNPAVESMAREHFSFLDIVPSTVILGDGRLMLEEEMSGQSVREYDMLVVDAFSSDAIPVHLLTREAAQLYRRALSPDGVLVINITNRYLDLSRVVRGMAEEAGFGAVRVRREWGETSGSASTWYLLSSSPAFLSAVGREAPPPANEPPPIVWTDGFSNLLQVLR